MLYQLSYVGVPMHATGAAWLRPQRPVAFEVWFDSRVDRNAVLAAFDEQVRRCPEPIAGEYVESEDRLVRLISESGGWSGVTWCDLDEASADRIIARQIDRFAELGEPWGSVR